MKHGPKHFLLLNTMEYCGDHGEHDFDTIDGTREILQVPRPAPPSSTALIAELPSTPPPRATQITERARGSDHGHNTSPHSHQETSRSRRQIVDETRTEAFPAAEHNGVLWRSRGA